MIDKKSRINASFVLDQKLVSRGGCAGNIAYGFQAMDFDNFDLVSVLGANDATDYIEYLQSLKISTEYIALIDGSFSSCAYISTDQALDQLTFFIANQAEDPNMKYLKFGNPADYGLAILSPHNMNLIVEAFRFARDNKIDIVFDPGQQLSAFGAKLFREILANSKYLILNKQELEYALELYDLSYDELLNTVDYVIVTDSENPVVIQSHMHNYNQTFEPEMSSKVVDPTGCGDAFRAGFFASLSMGLEMNECVKRAMYLAGLCLGSPVTQDYL